MTAHLYKNTKKIYSFCYCHISTRVVGGVRAVRFIHSIVFSGEVPKIGTLLIFNPSICSALGITAFTFCPNTPACANAAPLPLPPKTDEYALDAVLNTPPATDAWVAFIWLQRPPPITLFMVPCVIWLSRPPPIMFVALAAEQFENGSVYL
jgi:hypothetical protein